MFVSYDWVFDYLPVFNGIFRYRTPAFAGYDNLEDKYWKFLTYNQPIYGADVPASLFDKDQVCLLWYT